MQKVAEFEKVSFRAFLEAMKESFYVTPEMSKQYESVVKSIYDGIQLPARATTGSAGYDFKMPYAMEITPGDSVKFPTGIRVKIDEGWWLGCFPRSSLGFKYRAQLDNTVGVIDCDYYYSDNEGQIYAKITNDSKDPNNVMSLNTGDAFMQGIFLPYGITYSDNATAVRNGGIGSTGR